MTEYTASIEYNPDTLHRLNAAINATFRFGLKLIYLAICIGLMFAGASIGLQNPRGVALIGIGCFLLPSVRAIEKSRAEQAIRNMNGKTLTVNYSFYKDRFVCASAKERNEFQYSSIIRLVEEPDYLYLFPNANQAYMISTATLHPNHSEKFKSFIATKVGLEWTKPMSLLTLNIRRLHFNRKNTKSPR